MCVLKKVEMRFLNRDKNVASCSTGFAKPMAKSPLGQSSKELPDISLDRIPPTHLSPPDDVRREWSR
jgi:hypothetical protein